jgi:plastocyanin
MGRPLPALVLCAALLAGCGDGDDGEGSGERALTVRAGQPVRVLGDEYLFSPSRVVVTRAPSRRPTTVRLALANEGALAHNLRVFDGDRELGGTPTFPGGETRSGTVQLLPGDYRMVCTVGNHAELGMVGDLEVRVR